MSEKDKERYKKELGQFFDDRTDLQKKYQKLPTYLKKLSPERANKKPTTTGYILFVKDNSHRFTSNVVVQLAELWRQLPEGEKEVCSKKKKSVVYLDV